ncbi:Uncharacterized conserved protein, DUF924 family [Pseudomonas linyingensis]|uniref:Uncharacterized conserved protein, DUF924 family n=1 Tax=Pseudomonas linyingensis TaxID=915471 RepID=A0A1H6TRF2_9PSED|nr:DUF924 family protein [Pseudomonas linyingensis]SEI79787.1 Uncharacterized conserved protein, DUF924 family [Pseudomonas linyingensis]
MAAPWQPLLDWWFGPSSEAAEVAAQKHGLWFAKRTTQDAEARERFGVFVAAALEGGLEGWCAEPDGWLALLLLLDQLPRMIHRDTPRAFAGDARARELALAGLAECREAQLPAIRRVFVYLVLEHAEDLALQDEAVRRFRQLHEQAAPAELAAFTGFLDYAERHRAVIARFGRFPHRNAILGRPSTPAELAFLAEPGARF